MGEVEPSVGRRDISAILLAVYLWMFTILRVAWAFEPRYSTEVLAFLATGILATSLISGGSRVRKTTERGVILLAIVLTSILLDMLLRDNFVLGQRLYEFAIYAVVPVLLLSQVRDLRQFFRTYATLAVCVFLLYVLDPVNDYWFSRSYMVYGFQAMLPAFFGMHLARREFGYRILLVPEIVCFAMMALFGNRMAAVAALFFVVVYEIASGRSSQTRMMRYTAFAGLGALVVANLNTLVFWIAAAVKARGYSSYSLNAAVYYLTGSSDSLSAGRDALRTTATALIVDRPLLGHGLGYFESIAGTYPHNFVLELLVSYGVFGFLFYLAGLLNGIGQIARSSGSLRILGVLLLCTAFPKLLTSVYVFIEPAYWMLIFYGLFAPIYRRGEAHVHGQVTAVAQPTE